DPACRACEMARCESLLRAAAHAGERRQGDRGRVRALQGRNRAAEGCGVSFARVPGAMQRETLLRRTGTHQLELRNYRARTSGWTPDQQRITSRCAASGERPSSGVLTTGYRPILAHRPALRPAPASESA